LAHGARPDWVTIATNAEACFPVKHLPMPMSVVTGLDLEPRSAIGDGYHLCRDTEEVTARATMAIVPNKPRSLQIAIVCEDVRIANELAQQLNSFGIETVHVPTSALSASESAAAFDVYLLVDPISQLLQRLRQLELAHSIAVLVAILSQDADARASWIDAGADDCISLPANGSELAARARSLLRRCRHHSNTENTACAGRLTMNLLDRDAYLDGNRLELTSNEFDLLAALARYAGRVLSREQLQEVTKGTLDETFERSIDVQVSRLRAKLGDKSRKPQLLKTIRGKGYLLCGS